MLPQIGREGIPFEVARICVEDGPRRQARSLDGGGAGCGNLESHRGGRRARNAAGDRRCGPGETTSKLSRTALSPARASTMALARQSPSKAAIATRNARGLAGLGLQVFRDLRRVEVLVREMAVVGRGGGREPQIADSGKSRCDAFGAGE